MEAHCGVEAGSRNTLSSLVYTGCTLAEVRRILFCDLYLIVGQHMEDSHRPIQTVQKFRDLLAVPTARLHLGPARSRPFWLLPLCSDMRTWSHASRHLLSNQSKVASEHDVSAARNEVFAANVVCESSTLRAGCAQLLF
jgi:hypothetical protein